MSGLERRKSAVERLQAIGMLQTTRFVRTVLVARNVSGLGNQTDKTALGVDPTTGDVYAAWSDFHGFGCNEIDHHRRTIHTRTLASAAVESECTGRALRRDHRSRQQPREGRRSRPSRDLQAVVVLGGDPGGVDVLVESPGAVEAGVEGRGAGTACLGVTGDVGAVVVG